MKDVVKEFDDDLNKLIDKENGIDELLLLWNANNKIVKFAEQRDSKIKTKIKVYLKERKWNNYKDEKTKIGVSISIQKRKVVDMEQLKVMLTESQLAQVLNTTSFERMSIITPEARKRLRKYVTRK